MLQIHDKFWAIDGDYSIELNEVFCPRPAPLEIHRIPVLYQGDLFSGHYTNTWLSYRWQSMPVHYVSPTDKRPLLLDDTQLVFAANPKLFIKDGKQFAAPGFSLPSSVITRATGRAILFSFKIKNLTLAYDLLKSRTIDGLYYLNKEVFADFHQHPSLSLLESLNSEFDRGHFTAIKTWIQIAPQYKDAFSCIHDVNIINDAIDKYQSGWRHSDEIVKSFGLPYSFSKFLTTKSFGTLTMAEPSTIYNIFDHPDFFNSLEPWMKQMLSHATSNSKFTGSILSATF